MRTVVLYSVEGVDEEILKLTRGELAGRRQLYIHSGTVHSVLHFVWFTGSTAVNLIGCDESRAGHDSRLPNKSRTRHGLKEGDDQSKALEWSAIRRQIQEGMIRDLGLEARYL